MPRWPRTGTRTFETLVEYWRSSTDIFGEAVALTIGTLLPIMNPFSTLPLFMALTPNSDEKSRRRVAFSACHLRLWSS